MSFLKESTLMHMILVGTYLTLGLFINLVQAVAYCFIRPVNARFYRNLNGYLTYAHWNRKYESSISGIEVIAVIPLRIIYVL